MLKGKQVGLLTHPAGVNHKGISTISILTENPAVECVALFGPEHGIYGNEKANRPIEDRIDYKTGLPVYSLYGPYRKPQSVMLSNIDVLVIDLQDIGVRSYTYISCMLYAMEACFQNGVEVIVLDRPNPLGGLKVDGPILEKKWKSYVGAFPIPYVHGLTIGELAILAKKMPNWMSIEPNIRRNGKLTVIPMKGWKRWMLWNETKLNWIPTSPNIPSSASVLGYAMTGLGAQEGGFRHGIGTKYPFRFLNHELLRPEQLLRKLKSYNINGLNFKITKSKNQKGKHVEGVYVIVEDWEKLRPTELSFCMMNLDWKIQPENPFIKSKRSTLFNKHVGSSGWWRELTQNRKPPRTDKFIQEWEIEQKDFIKMVQNYLIYN